jgi:hypothetical protein
VYINRATFRSIQLSFSPLEELQPPFFSLLLFYYDTPINPYNVSGFEGKSILLGYSLHFARLRKYSIQNTLIYDKVLS